MLANPNGTAPGWWVDRPDGRVIVTLPGPPREMRPMWANEVLPRLAARGVGVETEVRTLRLTGIGESQVAELLGEPLLRAANPIVATYARQEAVDVRISARADAGRAARDVVGRGRGRGARRRSASSSGGAATRRGRARWRRRSRRAAGRSRRPRRGTGGALVGLLRGLEAVRRSEVARDPAGVETADAGPDDRARDEARDLAEADRVRAAGATDVGLSLRAVAAGDDTAVHIGIVTPAGRHAERRLAFLRGTTGADRAAINGAAVLLAVLRAAEG